MWFNPFVYKMSASDALGLVPCGSLYDQEGQVFPAAGLTGLRNPIFQKWSWGGTSTDLNVARDFGWSGMIYGPVTNEANIYAGNPLALVPYVQQPTIGAAYTSGNYYSIDAVWTNLSTRTSKILLTFVPYVGSGNYPAVTGLVTSYTAFTVNDSCPLQWATTIVGMPVNRQSNQTCIVTATVNGSGASATFCVRVDNYGVPGTAVPANQLQVVLTFFF